MKRGKDDPTIFITLSKFKFKMQLKHQLKLAHNDKGYKIHGSPLKP